jgi:hypothetical protein
MQLALLVYMRLLVIGIRIGMGYASPNGGNASCVVNDDIAQPREKRDRGWAEVGAITPQIPICPRKHGVPAFLPRRTLVACPPDTRSLL